MFLEAVAVTKSAEFSEEVQTTTGLPHLEETIFLDYLVVDHYQQVLCNKFINRL